MPNPLLLLAIVVLLPIVPAFLFYTYLPSTTIAEGPFKGLQIQLTGAFAAYFLTLLVVIGAAEVWTGSASARRVEELERELATLKGELDQQFALWTIKGWVQEDGLPGAPPDFDRAQVVIRPPQPVVTRNGTFSIKGVPISKRSLLEGTTLEIVQDGYEPATVSLSLDGATAAGRPGMAYRLNVLDSLERVAEVGGRIRLTKIDPTEAYRPEGAQPAEPVLPPPTAAE